MASTTFIDQQTIIYAAWLNDVNNAVYNGVFQAATISPTNIICNGSLSGSAFTGLVNADLLTPGPIGSVTPNTGAFTTLSATSLSGLTTALSVAQGGTGLQSVGTSGYPLASTGSGYTFKKLGLGMTGEIWHDLTAGRSNNVTYTNNNSYPIMYSVTIQGQNQYCLVQLVVNGVVVANQGMAPTGGGNVVVCATAIVPPGATYSQPFTTGSLLFWSELY